MKIDILKLLSHFVSLFEGRMAVYVALVPGAGSENHTCFLCPRQSVNISSAALCWGSAQYSSAGSRF